MLANPDPVHLQQKELNWMFVTWGVGQKQSWAEKPFPTHFIPFHADSVVVTIRSNGYQSGPFSPEEPF